MSCRVVFSPQAQEQLIELFHYIAKEVSPATTGRYTDAIVSYCEDLCISPQRGTKRDDVRPGLRITNYKKRTVIAFDVTDGTVSIIGIFYGGRDYESLLGDHQD